jgi:hypothetical protein
VPDVESGGDRFQGVGGMRPTNTGVIKKPDRLSKKQGRIQKV